MTKTMSLKQARSRFSSIIDKAGRLSERYIVTKNGTPKAVKALQQGLKEAKAGKMRSFNDVFGKDQ